MIKTNDVKRVMDVQVAMSEDMVNALIKWCEMYSNASPWLTNDIKSLNLAAAISSELARSTTIEMEVVISGSPRAEYLTAQFEKVMKSIRANVEYGCAKGGLMFKPYVNDTNNIVIDYIQADQFYPVDFDSNGNISACVFSDQRIVGDKYYTRLEYHAMTPQGCVVMNRAFKSTVKDTLGDEIPLTDVEDWAGLEQEALIAGIDKPLFAYFKYPAANSIDPTSPLGVSCFARAVDLIEQADKQWSNFLWENESAQRALYVDELAFGQDGDGKPILPNKRLYRTLQQGGELTDEEMFHEWNPEIRDVSILNSLDAILRRIEFVCGLAYGTLSNPQTVDKTATEIKISNQRTYATVSDAQKALQDALDQLLYAMDVWATLNNLAPQGSYDVTYNFDDSVVVDKQEQASSDLQLVGSTIMGKVEWRMRNFKEDEATAKKMVAQAISEMPQELSYGDYGRV